MKNNVNKVNELMLKIHQLHKDYSLEEENYNTIYSEFYDKNSQSSKLITEVSSILIEDENQTIEYFKQCDLLDFYILVCEHEIDFSKNLCKKLINIWEERTTKKEKNIFNDVIEYLIHEQTY